MTPRFVVVLVAVAAVVFGGALAVTRALSEETSSDAVPTRQAAVTSLPGLTPATEDAALPSLRSLAPAPRTVAQAAGPFDDRFELRGLSFDGKQVRGSAQITSDVSEILELEVLAGFYDVQGRLLGTARYVHDVTEPPANCHEAAGTPAEAEPFTIAVPGRLRGTAVSAAVGVPVLVNE
jgi:hypothetical protein